MAAFDPPVDEFGHDLLARERRDYQGPAQAGEYRARGQERPQRLEVRAEIIYAVVADDEVRAVRRQADVQDLVHDVRVGRAPADQRHGERRAVPEPPENVVFPFGQRHQGRFVAVDPDQVADLGVHVPFEVLALAHPQIDHPGSVREVHYLFGLQGGGRGGVRLVRHALGGGEIRCLGVVQVCVREVFQYHHPSLFRDRDVVVHYSAAVFELVLAVADEQPFGRPRRHLVAAHLDHQVVDVRQGVGVVVHVRPRIRRRRELDGPVLLPGVGREQVLVPRTFDQFQLLDLTGRRGREQEIKVEARPFDVRRAPIHPARAPSGQKVYRGVLFVFPLVRHRVHVRLARLRQYDAVRLVTQRAVVDFPPQLVEGRPHGVLVGQLVEPLRGDVQPVVADEIARRRQDPLPLPESLLGEVFALERDDVERQKLVQFGQELAVENRRGLAVAQAGGMRTARRPAVAARGVAVDAGAVPVVSALLELVEIVRQHVAVAGAQHGQPPDSVRFLRQVEAERGVYAAVRLPAQRAHRGKEPLEPDGAPRGRPVDEGRNEPEFALV